MFDKYIEKVIRERCKGSEILNDFKSIKLLTMKYRDTVKCYKGVMMVKYDVVCSCKKLDNGHNRVKFEVCIYDNPNGTEDNTTSIYFDGTCYDFEV